MLRHAFAVLASTLVLAVPARATEIFSAEGAWLGEGRLATGAEAPLERGRCRVAVKPVPGGEDVSVTGNCAVAAGMSDISLRVVRSGSGKVNAGFWSAATGQTIQLSGQEAGGEIALISTTPLMIDDAVYETRVDVSALDDDSFSIRQLLRAEGEEAWRLVVDMIYHRADG